MNTVNLLGQEGYILLMQRVYMQTFKPTTGLKKKKKARKSMIRKRMKGKQCMASSAKHEVSSPASVGDSSLGSHCVIPRCLPRGVALHQQPAAGSGPA